MRLPAYLSTRPSLRSLRDSRALRPCRRVANHTRCTALHFHVGMGGAQLCVTEALLEACPEAVRARDRNGQLPLHWAVMHTTAFIESAFESATPVVQALLRAHPAGAMAWDVEGNLALHGAAVDNATLEVIHLLIEANPSAAAARNLAGETPLDLARVVAGPGGSAEVGGRLALLEQAAAAVPDSDVVPNDDAGSMRGFVCEICAGGRGVEV